MKRKIIFMLDEEWKVIKDFLNYAVSNYGRIKRIRNSKTSRIGKILKVIKTTGGYLKINLSKDKKQKTFYVHIK